MKRCVTCNAVYESGERFCDNDGTPLLSTASPAPPPHVERNRAALKTLFFAAAAIAMAAAVGLATLYALNHQPGQQTANDEGIRSSAVVNSRVARSPVAIPEKSPAVSSDWLRALLGPPSTPTPTPTPTPEPTPSATPTPKAVPVQARVEDPAAKGADGESVIATMTVIRFSDGTSLEVDDVWRDSEGAVWYKRGGMMARLEGRRVKSVVRPPVVEGPPAPAPQPSPEAQKTPETTPTP
jgi:hypothetical protein